MNKLKGMPVPLLPTMVGAMTLANVLNNFDGFTWVRNATFIAATIIWLAYCLKVIFFFDVCKNEYSQTVPASLYAGFPMMMMLLGSFYLPYNAMIGKGLWFAGVIIDTCHIICFIINNLIKKRSWDTFVPSWFVTSNGIMVAAVIGAPMEQPLICTIITYWGIIAFTCLIPFMVYRLATKPIKAGMYHTQAIVLAPCSLSIVCYLTHIANPIPFVVYYLYIAVICSLIFICIKLPSFFEVPFYPGFAGLTFPMAIGIVATTKFIGYLGEGTLATVLTQIKGFQIYFTCGLVFYVLLGFIRLFINSFKKA